jgi:hypothetical protein
VAREAEFVYRQVKQGKLRSESAEGHGTKRADLRARMAGFGLLMDCFRVSYRRLYRAWKRQASASSYHYLCQHALLDPEISPFLCGCHLKVQGTWMALTPSISFSLDLDEENA